MSRSRTSKRKWGNILLWASISVGLVLIADGVYYLIPAERVSRSLVPFNWAILAAYGVVMIWSLIYLVRGISRRDFTTLIPFIINLLSIVVYMLTSVVEQMGD